MLFINTLNVKIILPICSYVGKEIWSSHKIYTQTKVKQHHIFFGETVLEVAERNMWVMEIKYFEFYCKFYYYFYEHLELK